MELQVRPSNRWCVVEKRAKFSLDSIRKEILRHENVQGEFTLPATPAPARDQTLFKVYADGAQLLVAVAVFESVGPTLRHFSYHVQPLPNRNTIEMFFAPWNDELGWFQFCFLPDGTAPTSNHLPYPEVHSTRFAYLQPKRFLWRQDKGSHSHRLYWLFAWFSIEGTFRGGPVCGFNVTRQTPPIEESSSWNHASAVGFQDATCFGKLHLRKPATVDSVRVTLTGNKLTIEAKARRIKLDLVDPKGARREIGTKLGIEPKLHGRYRICPSAPGAVEPEYYSFDLISEQQAKAFRFSVTYDIPDNITYTNYYTPQRLERELATWKSWGINRIYWIEYGPLSQWPSLWSPSFWQMSGARRTRLLENVALTRRRCDDTLHWAVQSAKRLGLEIFAVYKPFDLGFSAYTENDGWSCVKDIENRYLCAHPDVAAHPEFTMRAHPAWLRRPIFPITRLCLYSEKPIPSFAAARLTIWTSTDNRRYTKYRGPCRVRAGVVQRPHYRWTPAGRVAEPSRAKNWRVELAGMALRAPFVAIEIEGKSFPLTHRQFAFAEAWGADGSEAPITLSTGGSREQGCQFNKTWLGWANHTEPVLDSYTWSGTELGLWFGDAENVPTLLEPTFAGARQIWLRHVQRILDTGVDGVDIRTIGHHNCVASYLKYAFAEPVREEFRRRFGRDVEATDADYEEVRHIRGEAYTQFLRDAKALAKRYRQKLLAHIEWGAEVPPYLDTRLQMQMTVEWQRWIRERIVDEVSLRGWACLNPYVHQELLPLARRHGVGVHIISKNLPGGMDLRAMELCERLVTEACAAGFAGYNLYEADNLLRTNAEGIPMAVGNIEQAVRKAAASLRGEHSNTRK